MLMTLGLNWGNEEITDMCGKLRLGGSGTLMTMHHQYSRNAASITSAEQEVDCNVVSVGSSRAGEEAVSDVAATLCTHCPYQR